MNTKHPAEKKPWEMTPEELAAQKRPADPKSNLPERPAGATDDDYRRICAEAVQRELREGSAYSGSRSAITALVWISVFATFVSAVISVVQAGYWTIPLCFLATVFVCALSRSILFALLDIADLNIRDEVRSRLMTPAEVKKPE